MPRQKKEEDRRRTVGLQFFKDPKKWTVAAGWKRLALELMEELRQIPGNRWNRRKGKDD